MLLWDLFKIPSRIISQGISMVKITSAVLKALKAFRNLSEFNFGLDSLDSNMVNTKIITSPTRHAT